MFIQGDVLAFISLLIGTCVSSWALTMAYGLLFPSKSLVAQRAITESPWKCMGLGALVVATLGLFGVILIGSVPNPIVKLLGWVIVLSIFSVASVGMAGIALNAGDRLRNMAPEMNYYAAFSRGAAVLIVACIVPVIGWLAFGPVLYLASIGAGVKALRTRVAEEAPLAHVETA